MGSPKDPVAVVDVDVPGGSSDLRDVTVTVQNVSSEPIYYAEVVILLPEVREQDLPSAFLLSYGRIEFIKGEVRPRADDIPLSPGETVSLRMESLEYTNFLAYYAWRGEPVPSYSRFSVHLRLATFADGRTYSATHNFVPKP